MDGTYRYFSYRVTELESKGKHEEAAILKDGASKLKEIEDKVRRLLDKETQPAEQPAPDTE